MKIVRTPHLTSALPFALLLLASPVAAQEVISLGTNVSGTIASTGEVDWFSVTTAIATRGLRCSRCGEHFAPPLFACPRCQQCDREVPAS